MLTIGITAVYQPHFTKMCLESVLNDSYVRDHQCTVIVVLNGAEYEVGEVVAAMDKKYPGQVKIVTNADDLGYATACNQILDRTATEYVAFLHNDTIVPQNTFRQLMASAQIIHEGIVGLVPMTNYANEGWPCVQSARKMFEQVKPPNKELMTPKILKDVIDHVYDGDLNAFAQKVTDQNSGQKEVCEDLTSYCNVFRTDVLKDVGGFNEKFTSRGYEEKDLYNRLKQDGFQVILCNDAFVHHHGNMTTDGPDRCYPDIAEAHRKILDSLIIEQRARRHKEAQATYIPSTLISHSVAMPEQEKRKLKVLFFGTNYPPENAGGGELSAHNALKELAMYNIEALAVTTRDRYHKRFRDFKETTHEGIPVLQVPDLNGRDLQAKLQHIVSTYKPDLIWAQTSAAANIFSTEATIGVKKIFCFRHQVDIDRGWLDSVLKKAGDVRVVSNSKWMQKYMLEKCRRDSDIVLPAVFPRQCISEINNRKSVIIVNGVASKGIREFLLAAQMLRDYTFKIYGTLDPTIREEELPSNVEYRGWKNDIRELFVDARVLTCLSLEKEPYGRAMIEALYNEVPVIAHNEGGPKEIIDKGGILTDNVDQTVEAIRTMYEDEAAYDLYCKGTQEDLKKYNPYKENAQLMRIVFEELGMGQEAEYAF